MFLGIDLGTSGARASLIDGDRRLVAQSLAPLPPGRSLWPGYHEQDPADWWSALGQCLTALGRQTDLVSVTALCVDGTSGSLLLCDPAGRPLTPALMYNDRRATDAAATIARHAPPDSGAIGAGSGLAKLLWLQDAYPPRAGWRALHQADWIAGRLTGDFATSDYNNALKSGYDPLRACWPAWLAALGVSETKLPTVVAPGTAIGTVHPEVARRFGFGAHARVVAGTTDSVAAFLAAGARHPGDGVTSLGSTLVLKLLSDRPVFSAPHGVYSHRLGDRWLAGGASNSGGAVLLKYFDPAEMAQLSERLDPARPTGLDYYPLLEPGERFPVNDPGYAPRMAPVPPDRALFFQGLLEGIARIEAQGYRLLQQSGAPALQSVRSSGGGSRNPAWTAIRGSLLGVPMLPADATEASVGAALIAAGIVESDFRTVG